MYPHQAFLAYPLQFIAMCLYALPQWIQVRLPIEFNWEIRPGVSESLSRQMLCGCSLSVGKRYPGVRGFRQPGHTCMGGHSCLTQPQNAVCLSPLLLRKLVWVLGHAWNTLNSHQNPLSMPGLGPAVGESERQLGPCGRGRTPPP